MEKFILYPVSRPENSQTLVMSMFQMSRISQRIFSFLFNVQYFHLEDCELLRRVAGFVDYR